MVSPDDLSSAPIGVALLDKPAGPTSFRMVQMVRRLIGVKKVGHAGTLDPFATGLLIVSIGRPATKLISRLMSGDKEYLATVKLGQETDSGDFTGKVIRVGDADGVEGQAIAECLTGFQGEQLQVPPQYSALKHKGKPLYYYARKGIKVSKEPRRIMIKELELLSYQKDLLQIRVVCSKGTYIRTLAADIGNELGCGGHLTSLRRLASGCFSVADALDGNLLTQTHSPELRQQFRAGLMSVDQVVKLL